MKINILTLFPEMFEPLKQSLLGKAAEKGILEFNIINIRDFSQDKHNKADDYPFGGGVGMVMFCDPIFRAMEGLKGKNLYMSPRGKVMDEDKILSLSQEEEITILCGHYEGVDQRALDHFEMEEVSIGDYVLTGGELPAMVLIDAVARFIPGVLGDSECASDDSIYTGLLEHDQYTKPREYEGMQVPEVLFNGNHKLIHLWQYENSLVNTKRNRPDLFWAYVDKEKDLTKEEKKILDLVIKMEL
ncbi:MAG: tRNA (guanosine(37)-N1)-methyltransferase TrmD [Clostridia bacterium]|nr:tRNA (guanosine(37)-N1)-methyltransferase TrmD [Clostridia bacterium]